jgi:hypothetical protein
MTPSSKWSSEANMMENSGINRWSHHRLNSITLLTATREYASDQSLPSHVDIMRMKQVTSSGIGEIPPWGVPSWVLHQKHESRINLLFVWWNAANQICAYPNMEKKTCIDTTMIKNLNISLKNRYNDKYFKEKICSINRDLRKYYA